MGKEIDLSIIRKNLEGRKRVLTDTDDDLTYSQNYELAVVCLQLAKVYRLEGKDKEADNYDKFSRNVMMEVVGQTNNDPTYLNEARLMYEHFGEALPAELESAIQEHERKVAEAKEKKSFLGRFLGSLPDELNGSREIECETVEDALVRMGKVERSLDFEGKAREIAAKNYSEDIARAVEKALLGAMYVASFPDYDLECGVEGEYLEELLGPGALDNIREVREKILSGEIDLSRMPEHFRQYDFGPRVEVDEKFTREMDISIKKLEYLDDKIKRAKDPKQREALQYLRDTIDNSLTLKELLLDSPEALVATGIGEVVKGPTDIGTSNERRMFYFINTATRALKPFIPELKNRMERSVGSYEDVYLGWDLVKARFPVFEEVEAVGAIGIAKAFREMGYKGMKDAVRGLIDTSDGTPNCVEGNRIAGFVKRAVGEVKKLGYDLQAKTNGVS
jgi:hypothetical protein